MIIDNNPSKVYNTFVGVRERENIMEKEFDNKFEEKFEEKILKKFTDKFGEGFEGKFEEGFMEDIIKDVQDEIGDKIKILKKHGKGEGKNREGEHRHHEHPEHRHEHKGHGPKVYVKKFGKEHEGHNKFRRVQKTKLFTSKEDMVEFVNLKGEEGHQIDIFKIEEGLYKVVIIEKK
jgi:hypothetical protein